MEKRYVNATWELRKEGESDWPSEVRGVAAVVDQTTDLGWFEERIAPEAFNESDMNDVVVLFNHDPNQVLGRNSSGTATVETDETGNLVYSFIPDPQNPVHVSVVRSIQRGDVHQSSFAFTIKDSKWGNSEKYGERGLRNITRMEKIYDVSPVTYPAYAQTSVSARDKESLEKEREQFAPDNTPDLDFIQIIKTRYKNI